MFTGQLSEMFLRDFAERCLNEHRLSEGCYVKLLPTLEVCVLIVKSLICEHCRIFCMRCQFYTKLQMTKTYNKNRHEWRE